MVEGRAGSHLVEQLPVLRPSVSVLLPPGQVPAGHAAPGNANMWRFLAGGFLALGEASLAPRTEGGHAGSENEPEGRRDCWISQQWVFLSK